MAPGLGPDSSSARRGLGALAVILLALAFAWPFLRREAARSATPAGVPASAPSSSARAVARLQAASGRLRLAAADGAKAPPLPAASTPPVELMEPTACIESLVPEGTFGPGDLEWVCRQPDLWSIQLDLFARATKRGKGDGANLWRTLGRFELGAIALLRSTCCPGAPPFSAKVPVKNCGEVAEVVKTLSVNPSPENVRDYDQTMTCLADRKVWFPEGWARVNPKQSRESFDSLLTFILATHRR